MYRYDLLGIDSRHLYLALVALVAVLRLVELGAARRNTDRALAAGGVEVGSGHYRWMVALHTMFLGACAAEAWWLPTSPNRRLAIVALSLLAAAMAVRYWVIATLGPRWTTRIICRPGLALIQGGPYRFLRHPNYVAVAVEIAALPLVHAAWRTAALFTLANTALLAVRIPAEEEALRRYSGAPEEPRA